MATIGTSVPRVEDPSLLIGDGRFADDLAEPPGCLHAAFVRSPHAHARLVAVDTAAAAAMPGVRAVVTGAELARLTSPFLCGVRVAAHQYALAIDRVRYVGEAVALVVAENRYLAEDAADRIEVAYEPLAPVMDTDGALVPGAPVLHPDAGSNLLHERSFSYGDPDGAFATADHVISTTVRYPRNACTPVETFAVLAAWREGEDSYDVTANFQGPYTLHTVMARALGVPGNRLRVRTPPDSGGSFGTKQAVFPYVVALSIAARIARRPVKWIEDRLEHLAAATAATSRTTTLRAAVDGDGVIRALDWDQVEDCGAWLRAPEPATLYRMHGNMTGPYAIGSVRIRNRVVVSNRTPTGLMRGFGGPQVYFALERLMDRAAVELGLDALELRRRNLVPADAMPCTTAPGAVLDGGDYAATVERAVRDGGLAELERRRDAARSEGRLYGIGHAMVVEPSISNMGYITTLLTAEQRARAGPKNGALATATVAVDPSGAVTVSAASIPQGQGHRTVLAQVVGDELGLAPSQVATVSEHDTLKDAWSIASGNYSSRFAGAVAGAASLAAARIAERLRSAAATELNTTAEQVELADGMARARDNPDNAVALNRLAAQAHWAPLSASAGDTAGGLRETAFWTPPGLREPDDLDRVNSSATHGFIHDYCGVEVDPDDGSVRIDRYVTAHDAGRLLNPALADGQIRGGFAHGLGAALFEELAYRPDGAFLAGTLAEYCVPRATDIPELIVLHDHTPSPVTPTGARGLGEGNCMSTPVCLANAVSDAIGAQVDTLPLTRPRICALIGEPEPPPPDRVQPAAPQGPELRQSGVRSVAMGRPRLWAIITDPEHLVRLIPGCHSLESTGSRSWRAVASLGAGPVRGRFVARVRFVEMHEPERLEIAGTAEGPLGSASGRATIRLEPAGDGETDLAWDYEVAVSGTIAAVGGRVLNGAVRAVIDQAFAGLAPEPGPGGWLGRLLRRLLGGRR